MRIERITWAMAIAALMASAAGCTHGQTQRGPVVKKLEIDGNYAVSDRELKKRIVTAETSWIPFSSKKRFDRNVWTSDLKRIERYYQSHGYYEARVVEDEIDPTGADAVKIRVRVDEGRPTLVARVAVHGLEDLPTEQRDQAIARVQVREKEIFHEEGWAATKAGVLEDLVALGYAEARVGGSAKVDLATREAFIDLDVDPGARYRLGAVQVVQKGGERVEGWRIEEQVHEAMEGKHWYSPEVRSEVQQRVFDMGVFGAAQVRPGRGDPETGTIPLEVEVTEAPFHEVGAGVGFGFEQLRQEGHAVAEYTHRDFLGGLRRLTLRARAGWAFIPNIYTAVGGGDAVTRSGPVAKLAARLEQPRLFHPNFQLRADVEGERAIEPAYSFIGGRTRLGIKWRPRSWFTVEPSYNLELYRLGSGEARLGVAGPPQLLLGCPGTCILSYLEQRATYDRRDDPQEPRKGVYASVALQEGGGPLGGSFSYLRVVPEARGYLPFLPGQTLVLAGRVRAGSLIPLRGGDLDTPIVARFFSGGDDMRGFSTQRLSPMRLVQKTDPRGNYDAEPVPLGGNGLFEMSVEARYELRKGIFLAGFMDSGFVTTEHVPIRPSYFANNLLWAVGTGARYMTPVGPVRLDVAYRLPVGPGLPVFQPEQGALTFLPSQGCFGFGSGRPDRAGAPEGLCSVHLSIGEAF
jgi:translocation and assembly module TamA